MSIQQTCLVAESGTGGRGVTNIWRSPALYAEEYNIFLLKSKHSNNGALKKCINVYKKNSVALYKCQELELQGIRTMNI